MTSIGRISGILQPVFSLRSINDIGVGDFGALDGLFSWMQLAQQKMLMVLPLLPTAPGDSSPYSTRSAFGLNPLFIHLGWLPEGVSFTSAERATIEEARASPTVRYDLVFPVKMAALERAFEAFEDQGASARNREFEDWCRGNADWLDGYTLYTALSESYGRKSWTEWPASFATRDPKALDVARTEHRQRIRYHQWLQWVAEAQWSKVRQQARAKKILLCGDEPFIIGQDSADCWSWPQYLRRDARLGVPPDDFSADGQDWGLPWFDFEALAKDDDRWLRFRATKAASYYDYRRIDHAIGYFRQYVRDERTPRGRFIPDTAADQQALGERNFRILSDGAGIIAEDLGVIPRFARDTLAKLGLPGYQVMRWSREDGIYRDPRHYPTVSLVTTGTHDTETMKSWWLGAPEWERDAVCRTWPELHRFSTPPTEFTLEVHEALLQAALNSQSGICSLPWQDIFGESERVNTPGTVGDHNWAYRMRWDVESLTSLHETKRAAEWLARLTHESRRA
jgi:4-alpha-glucanotransferase